MPSSYYDLLGIATAASADDIGKAFRREMAKYHPDKVQHLAEEFRRLAAERAAELTQAYRTLSEPELRARYDANLSVLPSRRVAGRPAVADDLVKRAAAMKLRQAAQQALGPCEVPAAAGFELAWRPTRRRLWRAPSRWILARFVTRVDAEAVVTSWTTAERMRQETGGHAVCVMLLGSVVAPAAELVRAVAERRRAIPLGSRRRRVTVVAVDMRDWSAHVPHDAPRAVKALVSRLQSL